MNCNTQNAKLGTITEKTLVVGIDVGSEMHYARAFDWRGYEYSTKAFQFSNTEAGFSSFYTWMQDIATENGKQEILPGMEPTGHYWWEIGKFLQDNGFRPVLVNPHHVKKSKELDDNNPSKNDRKDPKVIAGLINEGRFSYPYLPADIKALGVDGVNQIWRDAKLRGAGLKRAKKLVEAAEHSIGSQEGLTAARMEIKNLMSDYQTYSQRLDELVELIDRLMAEIPYVDKVLQIKGVGIKTVSGFVAEVGDIRRFDNPKQIQKLAGYALVEDSSGKHQGETRISKRGRKRLRYLLFEVALSLVGKNDEFRELHYYYTHRAENPLKKKQSLIAIACKFLRVAYKILTTGVDYDAKKMLTDIKRPQNQLLQAA